MKKTAEMLVRPRILTGRRILQAVALSAAVVVIISLLYPAADTPASGPGVVLVVGPAVEGSDGLRSPYPDQARLLFWDHSRDEVRPLAPGLAPTSPPRVSFDGGRILFSARDEKRGPSQIWEVQPDGADLRKLTQCETDCLGPEYLPDDRIVLAREVPGVFEGPVASLFVLDTRTLQMEQITFNQDWMLVEGLAEDGRILLKRYTPERAGAGTLAVRPDGTELVEFLEAGQEPAYPQSVPGSSTPSADSDVWPPGWKAVEAVTLAPRPRPPVATSVVNPALSYGWLLCLDVKKSDLSWDTSLARQLRIWNATERKPIETVPLESDGSFFVRVPADQLIYLELLDSQGRPLGRQENGVWVRPNERRGCIGCHEPRYLSPENRLPLAVTKPAHEIGFDLPGLRADEAR